MILKIITYNIWQGRYLKQVIAFLKHEQPDIVQVQEVDEGITETLKQALAFNGQYRWMFTGEAGNGITDMGIATLTRWPILSTREWEYERTKTQATLDAVGKDRYHLPRVLLGCQIEIKHRPFWLFNTHFTITPHATVTPTQLKSARLVKQYVKGFSDYILTGDMNTPYQSETYHVLAKGLTDVSCGKEATLHPTFHKVAHLGLHVDYIFFKGRGLELITSRVPLVDGSDHLPVVAELKLTQEGIANRQ